MLSSLWLNYSVASLMLASAKSFEALLASLINFITSIIIYYFAAFILVQTYSKIISSDTLGPSWNETFSFPAFGESYSLASFLAFIAASYYALILLLSLFFTFSFSWIFYFFSASSIFLNIDSIFYGTSSIVLSYSSMVFYYVFKLSTF